MLLAVYVSFWYFALGGPDGQFREQRPQGGCPILHFLDENLNFVQVTQAQK
jgi:hypothetical protein